MSEVSKNRNSTFLSFELINYTPIFMSFPMNMCCYLVKMQMWAAYPISSKLVNCVLQFLVVLSSLDQLFMWGVSPISIFIQRQTSNVWTTLSLLKLMHLFIFYRGRRRNWCRKSRTTRNWKVIPWKNLEKTKILETYCGGSVKKEKEASYQKGTLQMLSIPT